MQMRSPPPCRCDGDGDGDGDVIDQRLIQRHLQGAEPVNRIRSAAAHSFPSNLRNSCPPK